MTPFPWRGPVQDISFRMREALMGLHRILNIHRDRAEAGNPRDPLEAANAARATARTLSALADQLEGARNEMLQLEAAE